MGFAEHARRFWRALTLRPRPDFALELERALQETPLAVRLRAFERAREKSDSSSRNDAATLVSTLQVRENRTT